jgi:hypothetical protein
MWTLDGKFQNFWKVEKKSRNVPSSVVQTIETDNNILDWGSHLIEVF